VLHASVHQIDPDSRRSLGHRVRGVFDHLTDSRGKITHTCARHDDGIAAAVRFLGNAQESSPIILAEFHVKMLAFNL
jgi:hypothetical protein